MPSVDSSSVFPVMEDVLEKLKLLNYEQFIQKFHPDLRPLNRVYFAQPTKASEQFPYFAHLASFLFGACGVRDAFEFSEFDDPNSIASAIVEQLRKLGFSMDFPPSKLRHGSGESVVASLDFLADKALAARRIIIQAPIYTAASEISEEAPANADGEDENDVEEEEKEEEEIAEDEGAEDAGATGESGESTRPQEILTSKVDPHDWKLELERVEPQLKTRTLQGLGKEWRAHLDQAAKQHAVLGDNFPQAKSALDKISVNLKKALDKILTLEKRMNKENEEICQEFRVRKETHDNDERELTALAEVVAGLKNQLSATEDELKRIKNSMSEKNNTMTDTQPMRKIAAALAAVKKEIASMELRIGVLSQAQTMWTLKQQAIKMMREQPSKPGKSSR